MSRHHVFTGKTKLGRTMRRIIRESGGSISLDDLMGELRGIGLANRALRGMIQAGSMKAYITVSESGEVWATGSRRGN